MKVKNKFKLFLASLMFATMFVSCGSDDGSGGAPGGGVAATSITLTADANNIFLNGEVTFTVTDDLGNDVTAQSDLKIDNASINNPHTFYQYGTFQIDATYLTLASNTVTVNVQSEADLSLFFSSNPASTSEMVTFTALDSFGQDVTSETTFSLDGSVISNPYQFSNVGENTVEASYNSFNASNVITITRSFTKKALLEDFTGTWCPNCPPAASAISSAISGNANVFGVSYHDGVGGYPDPMEIPETAFWSGYYNVTGFPTVYVNGPDTRWNFPNMAQVDAELAEVAPCGLALDVSMNGGQLNVEVKVAFSELPGEEIKLMLYLVEDDVVTSSPQSGSSQGANYVHKDVLREVYTDQLGDIIPSGSISLGQEYVRTFTGLTIPANVDNMANLKVIAYVRNTYTKTFVDYFNETHENSPHYDILNVQEVEMGGSIDFD